MAVKESVVGRCSLLKCIQGDLEVGMARVEIKAVPFSAVDKQQTEVCLFVTSA